MIGHIEDIAVSKSMQGRKLGLRIINALDAIGEAMGCYKIILDCSKNNIGEPQSGPWTRGPVLIASVLREVRVQAEGVPDGALSERYECTCSEAVIAPRLDAPCRNAIRKVMACDGGEERRIWYASVATEKAAPGVWRIWTVQL